MRAAAFIVATLTLAVAAEAQSVVQSSPNARRTMQQFGACVADRSPAKAAATLAMDFRTVTYRSALRNLSTNNRDCLRYGKMRSVSLGFAGAVAERLLERDPAPLNVRLARAFRQSAPPPRTASDAIALCVVRSVPDDVAKLFATEVASPEEAAAAASLQVAVNLCSRGKPRLETNVEGLRAMLATAALRTVSSPPGAERG